MLAVVVLVLVLALVPNENGDAFVALAAGIAAGLVENKDGAAAASASFYNHGEVSVQPADLYVRITRPYLVCRF